MAKQLNIIEVVEADAVSRNTIFPKNTIITFFNDTSKIKISDGRTAFNSLISIGGDLIPASVQTALNAKLTATKAATQANSTAVDVAGIVTDFNALLAKLKTAGIML